MFDEYGHYVDNIPNFDRDLRLIFNLLRDYYDKYPEEKAITADALHAFLEYQYPGMRNADSYKQLITRAFEMTPNLDVMTGLLEQMMERYYATQIVNKLIPVMEGSKYGILSETKQEIEAFDTRLKNPPVKLDALSACDLSVQQLIETEIQEEGLPWPLVNLNHSIGGVRRKTLGMIYAYVDSGKTSFGMAACAHFAASLIDTPDSIVYAGNEESAPRLALRLTQACLHWTRSEILKSPELAEEERRNRGYTRVKILDSVTTMKQVEKILELYRPYVLFVDQGTKLEHKHVDNEVRAAQQLFNFYREAAKRYNVAIVCLAQAVGDAENKKRLNLSDVYGSRVAIQGELDYAIGIGRVLSKTDEDDPLRYFNVPKNKLLEGASAQFVAKFEKARCQWLPV